MTCLAELGSIESIIQGTAIERSLVFKKPIHAVSLVEMTVLAKQCETHMGVREARNVMKQIMAELTKAKLLGAIADCPALSYNLSKPKLSIGELRRILIKFDHMERRLIVFALASGMSLTEASFVQHNEIKKISNINKWTNELRKFVSSTPRHLTCPYLFWSFGPKNLPNALVGFEHKFTDITKASWSVFANLCANLIPMDTEEDSREFATMFVLETINA